MKNGQKILLALVVIVSTGVYFLSRSVYWPGHMDLGTPGVSIAPTMEAPWQQFVQAEVIESLEGDPDAEGLVERTRIIKTEMKYPYVRVVEKVRASDLAGEPINFTATVADHMVVRVRDGLSEEKVATIATQNGFSVRKKMLAPDTYLIAVGNSSIDALPAALEALSEEANAVQYAEPDYLVFTAATTPNDPSFRQLWGMHQGNGKDIDAGEAWDLDQGSSSIVVAVIDTGIDYNHEDLAANMWRNPGEISGNGIDDDGNGFIDDVYGWDFCNDDSDPYDDNNHGTHCAGTIGAVGNNGIGVAGVNWRVKLMALKFLGASGSGADSDAVDCIYYATRQGARLTSDSWCFGGYSQAMKDAIDNANASNILFVAAAGNNAADNDASSQYPSSYSSANIIAVAATDSRDDLANFSCYGATSVDMAAPGVDIYSTIPTAQGKYASESGTSMAAPHIAGACALVAAYLPELNASQIKQRIMDNGDALSSLSGKCVTGKRLNLYKALTASIPQQSPAGPSAGNGTPGAGMVLIPGGTNSGTDPYFGSYSLTVSSFYMDKYEVTKAQWDEVANWAASHGYDISASSAAGKAANHPVQMVTWYDCVKWCNARSEKEEYDPAYYTSSLKTTVYKSGTLDIEDNCVDWNNGYRLPKSEEWRYAARGGLSGKWFPWGGDRIDQTKANYQCFCLDGSRHHSYDDGLVCGYHPDWNDGSMPYTSAVGTFEPNTYGLYDMAGNIREWCNDLDQYIPDEGLLRLTRGGSWADRADSARVSEGSVFPPSGTYHDIGFRACLPSDQ